MNAYVLLFSLCWLGLTSAQEKVNVTVYYESLCPDSKLFFTNQLYPTLQRNLSNYINLKLIPYGKSTQKQLSSKEWEFTCHHGPDECYGNKIQACALAIIDDGKNTPGLGYNKVTVAFINCLMAKSVKSPIDIPRKECAEINNVSKLNTIDNCSNHTDGSLYLAKLGNETFALKPALSSVPTIVFNNKYDEDDNMQAQSNFQKVLCKYITDNQPAECTKSDSPAVHVPVLLVTACLFVLKYFY